jgi:hypothetical protein
VGRVAVQGVFAVEGGVGSGEVLGVHGYNII